MSIDNGPGLGSDIPVGGISQPKSNKKIWIFGGLGCLGLIGLICIGFIVAGVFVGKPMFEFMNDNQAFIESSDEVAEALGAPITATTPQPIQDPNNPGALTFQGEVSGANGTGTYVIEATMNGVTPVRDAIYLEFNGEKIDLDADAMFEIDVDDGG